MNTEFENKTAFNTRLITYAPELYEALKALLRQLSNIEVLGEWEALDINHGTRKTTRAKVDAVVEQAKAALAKVNDTDSELKSE